MTKKRPKGRFIVYEFAKKTHDKYLSAHNGSLFPIVISDLSGSYSKPTSPWFESFWVNHRGHIPNQRALTLQSRSQGCILVECLECLY